MNNIFKHPSSVIFNVHALPAGHLAVIQIKTRTQKKLTVQRSNIADRTHHNGHSQRERKMIRGEMPVHFALQLLFLLSPLILMSSNLRSMYAYASGQAHLFHSMLDQNLEISRWIIGYSKDVIRFGRIFIARG